MRVRSDKGFEFGGRIEKQIGIGLLELVDDYRAQIITLLEILPGCVWIKITCKSDSFGNVGVNGSLQISADLIERSEANVASACDIKGGQVGADADEIIAHRIDDVEIDFLRLLRNRTGDDPISAQLLEARLRNIARRQWRGEGTCFVGRVQERIHQGDVVWLAVRADHRQFVTDQRMADAVDGGGKLLRDTGRRVRVVVGMAVRPAPLHAADQSIGKLGEHDALILAFIQDSRRLEEIFRTADKAGSF